MQASTLCYSTVFPNSSKSTVSAFHSSHQPPLPTTLLCRSRACCPLTALLLTTWSWTFHDMIPSVTSKLTILQIQYVTVNIPWVETCRPETKKTDPSEILLSNSQSKNVRNYHLKKINEALHKKKRDYWLSCSYLKRAFSNLHLIFFKSFFFF